MTITQNVASKLVVGFVVASMLFTLSFTPAKAATTDELQAQITALLAQIAALQGQAGQGGQSVASGVCPYSWNMDLKMGSTGADVMKLQQFLNADVETRVAASGAGSVGAETTTFGPATMAAVSKFQTKYRAEVLTPAGLVNPTGYFGPGTRAQANKICASAPASDDDSNDDANDDDANDDDSSTDLSGEASLDSFKIADGEDTDLEEGQEDAAIAELDIEFNDGDAMITRLDVAFVGTGDEQDPWDTFEEISLFVDGEEVARVDATDEDDYLDEDAGSMRFSGLDIVAMEDEEITVEVRVSVQSSVTGVSDDEAWTVAATSMRFVDGDGVSTTEDTFDEIDDTNSFTIGEEGGEDELIVKSSTADPDATTLALDASDRSDWTTVFVYKLDTDDSTNDITVNDLPVSMTVSSSTAGTFVNDIRLVIDGETYDDYTASTDAANRVYTFDIDGDLVIDAGEEVEVEVEVEFKALAAGNEGVTIFGAATSSDAIDAEGADDLGDDQTSGSATGETHTMRTEGVIIAAGDMESTFKENLDTTADDDEAVFTIEFEVTAFEADLYIVKSASMSSSTSAGSSGVHYIITDGSGTEKGTTTPVASLSSTADTETGRYVVREGETETFTLTVEYDAGVQGGGFYAAQLYSVNFNTDNAAPNTYQRALPGTDFETDAETI